MGKKNGKDNVETIVQNNELNNVPKEKHSFRLIFLGIALLIAGIVLFYFGEKKAIDIQKKQYVEAPKDHEGMTEFLKNNSNFSEIVEEWSFEDFWPKEYFEIKLKDKIISYWKDTECVTEVKYKDYSNVLKDFEDEDSKTLFEYYFPEMKNLEDLVEEDYRESINNANPDEKRKYLCFLYNALAGHPGSYVLLGRNEAQGDWKFYTPSDFPQHYIQLDSKHLMDLASSYASNIKKDPASVSPLNETAKDVVSISAKAISFDRRKDIIWCGDSSRHAGKADVDKGLPAPYNYQKLNEVSACGWVVPDNDKEKILRAIEYYRQDGRRIYIREDVVRNLNELKWNEKKKEPDVLYSIMKYLGIAFFLTGFIVLLYSIIKKFIKQRKNQKTTEAVPDSQEIGEKTKEELEAIVTEQIERINSMASKIQELEKSIKGKGEELAKAVENFKNSKEFKKLIENAKKEYEKTEDYKNLVKEAGKWRNFIDYTKESEVLRFLKEIHDVKESFPIPRSLAEIYSQAQAAAKDEEGRIAEVLAILDQQVGGNTRLPDAYKHLLADAKYAQEVRERFESAKTLANEYGERKEYMQIVSQNKDLTIWERVVIMLWAMECTNKLLTLFGKSHFAQEVVDNAAEKHKDDIMQIFATRIFKKYMEDPSSLVGGLATSRNKMMGDKISEMQNNFQIRMKESAEYKEFVKSLDSVHDKVKSEAAFIQMMKNGLVDEFLKKERKIEDKGQYLSLLVAMGLHMSDYIRYMSGNGIDYCPNTKFALSNMNTSQLDKNTEFRYKDPAYSGDYTNRVYEWLQSIGIIHLKALVDNRLIMP